MKKIILKDRIYGELKIDSPVIIELIKSKPLQRLKKICQYGVPDEFYHLKNYSRFEHSIGVFLLLKKLGASEEEQIAGLLHDISHTAFSHVVDWVLGDGKTEEFQNEQFKKFIEKTNIPEILLKHQYSLKRIVHHSNYSLLEQNIPNLCADRIDYAIREFPKKAAKICLENMINYKGRIVFKDKESAYLFAINFLKKQTIHWGGFEAASRYRLFANALKIALNEKIINFEDFWQNDNYILKKIKKAKNKEIQKILKVLRNRSLKNFQKSREVVYKKFRYVDPEFLEDGKFVRLSTLDLDFKKQLERVRKNNEKGIALPKIN